MIKKVKLTDSSEGPWKNGLGKTRQVAIFPHEATLLENNFHWRLSSATILGDNTFSQFFGFERWLIVWKGSGLILNGKNLLPNTPLNFSGEETIECSLIKEKVVDLGLIYDRKKCKADLTILSGSSDVAAGAGVVFLFQAAGNGKVGNLIMNEGDFLILENKTIRLELSEDALAYKFLIEHF